MKKLLPLLFILISFLLYHSSDGVGKSYFLKKFTNWNFTNGTIEAFVDPEIIGPDRLCNVFGSVIGTFSGMGNPDTDVYEWKIFGPSNQLLFSGSGGSGFQVITYTFSINGSHRIELSAFRGGQSIGSFLKIIEVIKGPDISLLPEYSICDSQTLTLNAIDPSTPNLSEYIFEWVDENNNVIGSQNEVDVTKPGIYSVVFYFLDTMGDRVCESKLNTTVSLLSDYELKSTSSVVCPDLPTTLTTSPNISGQWSYMKMGTTDLVALGFGNTFTILPNQNLPSSGDYTIFFEPENSNNSPCLQIKSLDLTYNPQPDFIILNTKSATDCSSLDGTLTIQAITPLDQVFIDGLGVSSPPLVPGSTYSFTNLKSGSYSLISILGNCTNAYGSVVPLENPPSQLIFDIIDIKGEECTDVGKTQGSFIIEFDNPPSSGFYRIINVKGTLVLSGSFVNETSIPITISGGVYYVEIYDDQDCNVPKATKVDVPSLSQTNFTVPNELFVCQSLDLIPNTTQSLEFIMIFPDGSQLTKDSGNPFTITAEGEHRLIGIIPNQSDICPSERVFTVNLIEPVDFEPVLISQDCFGNRTYEANIFGRDPLTVKFRWLDENNQLIGTGQFLDLDPSVFGNYSLDVQPANSSACPIPPKVFEIKEPILSVDVSLTSTKLCEFGPRAILTLTTTDFEEVTDIEWRRFDDLGQIEELPQFKNQTEIIADAEGIYEAAVFSIIPSIKKNCELGRKTFDLDLTPQKVDFSIPSSLSICDPYELIPQSTDPLTFMITFPNGTTQTKEWNEAFEISQPGTYILLGYNPDSAFPLCPEQKEFEVILNQPVQFSQKLENLSCTGVYEFSAEISNYPVSDVDIFWRDQGGNLIGSDQTLLLSSYGTFSLEVQPKGSIPCLIQPILFEVPVPVLSISADIIAETLCPDQQDTPLTVNADLTEVSTIEWWFTDINNNRSKLPTEPTQKEILARNEGTYEVLLSNQFGCLLGSDQVLVLRSTDSVRPVVEESYQICPRYEIGPQINPGNFSSYEWYFQDNLVSNSPSYKPNQIGNYSLIVYSSEGCAYETSFLTEEECELRVAFPNAIQPGNPDKPFLIYTNYLIDELEIYIFSKWGEVIFHCEKTELISEESTCVWDAYFNGQKVPPGSYAYRINYRNNEKNIAKKELGSILVID